MDHQYRKTCLKRPLKRKTKIGFQDQLSPNAGQKYCRMLQGEHSAILLTFIKLPFAFKNFVLSIVEWPLKTGLTVCRAISSIRQTDRQSDSQTDRQIISQVDSQLVSNAGKQIERHVN